MKRSGLVRIASVFGCLWALGFVAPASAHANVVHFGPASQIVSPTPAASLAPVSTTYSFDQPSGQYAADYDDHYLTEAAYNFTGLLSNGDRFISQDDNLVAKITFMNVPNGTSYFTPSINESNNFVGFLGLDPKGFESDKTVAPTLVATILDVTAGFLQVGYIMADYNTTKSDDTTFTTVNTSQFAFDPQFNSLDVFLQENLAPEPSPEPSSLVISSILLGMFGVGWMSKRLKQTATPA
jgi:hypothetical protein